MLGIEPFRIVDKAFRLWSHGLIYSAQLTLIWFYITAHVWGFGRDLNDWDRLAPRIFGDVTCYAGALFDLLTTIYFSSMLLRARGVPVFLMKWPWLVLRRSHVMDVFYRSVLRSSLLAPSRSVVGCFVLVFFMQWARLLVCSPGFFPHGSYNKLLVIACMAWYIRRRDYDMLRICLGTCLYLSSVSIIRYYSILSLWWVGRDC